MENEIGLTINSFTMTEDTINNSIGVFFLVVPSDNLDPKIHVLICFIATHIIQFLKRKLRTPLHNRHQRQFFVHRTPHQSLPLTPISIQGSHKVFPIKKVLAMLQTNYNSLDHQLLPITMFPCHVEASDFSPIHLTPVKYFHIRSIIHLNS